MQIADWINVLFLLIHFKVPGKVWITLLEIFELLVVHWLVVSVLS